MKLFIYLFALFFLSSCSSTRMVDSWLNDEYVNYHPKKVLIVGITDNLTARKIFEQELKNELIKRGVIAVESYGVFDLTFQNSKQTEKDINKEVKKLVNDGFDAILTSAVKGVDEKTSYTNDSFITGYYWRHFGRYYFLYQDVYFQPGYYNNYKVYNIESSLYNLNENSDKSLVWVASYQIVDPNTISATVNDYVKAIIKALEKETIIPTHK